MAGECLCVDVVDTHSAPSLDAGGERGSMLVCGAMSEHSCGGEQPAVRAVVAVDLIERPTGYRSRGDCHFEPTVGLLDHRSRVLDDMPEGITDAIAEVVREGRRRGSGDLGFARSVAVDDVVGAVLGGGACRGPLFW